MQVLYLLFLFLLSSGSTERRLKRHNITLVEHTLKKRDTSSSNIAIKAAEEARAAHAAQNAAGDHAAHMVKSRLAERALQAAKAAEAALSGKQALVEHLKQELKQAEALVERNTAHLKLQEETVNAAELAVKLAVAQHQQLLQALQQAEQLRKSSQSVLDKTKSGLQEKYLHLSDAKNRVAILQQRLQQALLECTETKKAADCAFQSAKAACSNIRRRKRGGRHIRRKKNLDLEKSSS